MSISVFDIYSIGIGPSSSHTVGPMRAARAFLNELTKIDLVKSTDSIVTSLYGSLALTGKGHGTDKAIILGLSGYSPESIIADEIEEILKTTRAKEKLYLHRSKDNEKIITFIETESIVFHTSKSLDYHPNGMSISAHNKDGKEVLKRTYFSIGGGFVVEESEIEKGAKDDVFSKHTSKLKYPFENATELISMSTEAKLSIAELMLENEKTWKSKDEISKGLLNIWAVMDACIEKGLRAEGLLPGGLNVKKRAKKLFESLQTKDRKNLNPLAILDWVNVYAIAVNEENASGGKVVTAPTNGAAGIIPAVIKYYLDFVEGSSEEKVIDFLLTAGGIGILYKLNASFSGAEVGCQGEVGVACSMAAAGLTQVMGGTNQQIENAAEIGMEHNLGLTCDPIGGLVQIPCIERNAMGAVKAINATRMALRGDGTHFVSLDKVIKTMKETGQDMQSKYKETSQGGLAVNVTEC